MCIKDSHVNEQSPVLEPCLSGSEKHICNFLMMKIIAVLFLFGFACGSSIPKPVHPNEGLIAAQTRNNQIRIIGGTGANIQEHKWQASLQIWGSHTCGAVIISSNYVVTAAHCVDGRNPEDFQIRVGSNLWRRGGTVHRVSEIIQHDSYNKGPGAFANDIALLRLSSGISLTENAGTVTLEEERISEADCVISGWGVTSEGGGGISQYLQEADTTVITDTKCSSHWGGNYNRDVHVCIHADSTGSCNGDSGGPLICKGKLVGVTSWGASGCWLTYPGVYTRISNYVSWIKDNSDV